MIEFMMPKVDHLSEEAFIVKWLKSEGDAVEKGEILLQIETGKSILEVESPYTGILKTILAKEGETVPVLTQIALFE